MVAMMSARMAIAIIRGMRFRRRTPAPRAGGGVSRSGDEGVFTG
jgi:hypothetical protein